MFLSLSLYLFFGIVQIGVLKWRVLLLLLNIRCSAVNMLSNIKKKNLNGFLNVCLYACLCEFISETAALYYTGYSLASLGSNLARFIDSTFYYAFPSAEAKQS